MTVTKRQKVFVMVFLLGLVALVVDRVFLRPQGGPEASSADSAALYAVPASGPVDVASTPSEAQNLTVAQRLARLWPEYDANVGDVRDPFSLSASWSDGAEDEGPVPDAVVEFTKVHSLAAVVVDGSQSYALLGDRLLTLGQEIDGFVLVSVGQKSAVFESQGERVTLELRK